MIAAICDCLTGRDPGRLDQALPTFAAKCSRSATLAAAAHRVGVIMGGWYM